MASLMVVGLFGSKGDADNAHHRLHTEGVAESAISEQVLHEISPPPHSMDAEFETLKADPFFWLLGNLRRDYARYIHNGETVVCVNVPSRQEADAIASILEMFEPVKVEYRPPEGAH